MGLSQPFMAASGDIEPHALTVSDPQKRLWSAPAEKPIGDRRAADVCWYFSGGACCLFYTRRYFRPILEDIDHVTEIGGDEGQPFFEELLPFPPNSVTTNRPLPIWKQKNRIYRGRWSRWRPTPSAWRKNERTKSTRRSIKCSLSSYQKLGAESRTVIDAMVDGISAQVLAEQFGKKMSTVYSYRRDIYGKVGIQGENKLQQLRVRVSLMRREQTEYGGSSAPSGENAGQAVNPNCSRAESVNTFSPCFYIS